METFEIAILEGLSADLKVKLTITWEEAEKFANGAEFLGLKCLVVYTEAEVTMLPTELIESQLTSLMMALGERENAREYTLNVCPKPDGSRLEEPNLRRIRLIKVKKAMACGMTFENMFTVDEEDEVTTKIGTLLCYAIDLRHLLALLSK
ncbi:hypothetical protein ACFE04_020944 [Oxalis oulophora]